MPARKRRAGRATEKAAYAALRLRARSPAGIPLTVLANGTFVPRASASGQASRGQRQSADIAANAIVGHSDAPRAPVLLLAGMMPEPPGCGLYLSARGRRTRSASREYPPQRRPLMSEIGGVYGHRFRQVKGVGILLDESAHFARHDSLRACGTRMILWRHGIRHWRPCLVPISPRF